MHFNRLKPYHTSQTLQEPEPERPNARGLDYPTEERDHPAEGDTPTEDDDDPAALLTWAPAEDQPVEPAEGRGGHVWRGRLRHATRAPDFYVAQTRHEDVPCQKGGIV